MKTMAKWCCLGLLLGGWVPAARAGLIIPDGDPNGVSDTRSFSAPFTELGSVTVTLNISGPGDGGFNGDLYVTLSYGSGYAVLLNRVGRTAGNAFGYSDSGLTVIFDDAATGQDVHLYRLVLNGSHTTPLGGPLTGTWQPDGRTTDPDLVLDTDGRSATLSSFRGLDPNGDWTLFAADLSYGGQSQLESWSLEFTPVPEPAWGGLGMGLGALVVALLRSSREARRGGSSSW
jgi:subtilisin-like proprotein convertase family protein